MSEKRFVIKSTATELELYNDDVQIGEFPHFEWVAKSVDSVVDLLNEQQDTIHELQDTVYDELDKALKVLGEIYEDYPKNNVYNLYNNLKGLKEMME